MAALSAAERQAILKAYAEDVSSRRELLPVSKPDMIAAVNAIDQWAEDMASNFNSAIPQPARGALTAKQKAQILLFVVRRRWEVA